VQKVPGPITELPVPDSNPEKIGAVYCRISSEDQSHFSLDTQRAAALSLAKA
jgi:hypothetical protein